MALLTKCIYGYETNPKNTPFGFLNNQKRLDAIIHNAGWFNVSGHRLGSGDLNLKDLQTISKLIPATEVFIALNEADSGWNIPSEMSHSEPGLKYVMDKAIWIVAKGMSGIGSIMRIRNDIAATEDKLQDGVKYSRMPREMLKKAFVKSDAVKKTTVDGGKNIPKTIPVQQQLIKLPPPVAVPAHATVSSGSVKKSGGFLSYVKPKTKPTVKVAKP